MKLSLIALRPIIVPKLVNNDHTGFIKGRFTGENIPLIDTVINYAGSKHSKGLLVFLDFEKAFATDPLFRDL